MYQLHSNGYKNGFHFGKMLNFRANIPNPKSYIHTKKNFIVKPIHSSPRNLKCLKNHLLKFYYFPGTPGKEHS